jgi:hypothetical protein
MSLCLFLPCQRSRTFFSSCHRALANAARWIRNLRSLNLCKLLKINRIPCRHNPIRRQPHSETQTRDSRDFTRNIFGINILHPTLLCFEYFASRGRGMGYPPELTSAKLTLSLKTSEPSPPSSRTPPPRASRDGGCLWCGEVKRQPRIRNPARHRAPRAGFLLRGRQLPHNHLRTL